MHPMKTFPTTLAQHILENLTYTVLMFDSQQRLDYINPSGEMLFAISANRLIGQRATAFLPADSHLVMAMQRGSDTGHPFTEHEVTLLLPGPREITVDYTVTPLKNHLGNNGVLVELQQIDRCRG